MGRASCHPSLTADRSRPTALRSTGWDHTSFKNTLQDPLFHVNQQWQTKCVLSPSSS